MMATKIVPINDYSDGDPSHVPKHGWKVVPNPEIYLVKLADQWMDAKGERRYGVNYKLDRLPEGYRLYQRPRPKDATIVDRHLYGHPGHKFFDSPNRFFSHFLHLMEKGTNVGCKCTLCSSKSTLSKNTVKLPAGAGPRRVANTRTRVVEAAPRIAETIANLKPGVSTWIRGVQAKRLLDDEGTPDVLRALIDRLKREGGYVEATYEEPMSMDWRAQREALARWLDEVQDQAAWIPRQGEIVMFVRDLERKEVAYDANAGSFRVFDVDMNQFIGDPNWEAAVVAQTPEEPLNYSDLIAEGSKSTSIATSGFRLEPLADPLSKDKRLAKRYKYVALHQIRPFFLWEHYLGKIPEEQWNPTILNAITVAASCSVLDKKEFYGIWPKAALLCRAVYLGAELICVGDAVHILPHDNNASRPTDILMVEKIKIKIYNLDKASDNDNDDGHPYNLKIVLDGKILTSDASRAHGSTPIHQIDVGEPLPVGLQGYHDLYPTHDLHKSREVPCHFVMGRCFERDAMVIWLPQLQHSSTTATSFGDKGLKGIRQARAFSREHDTRLHAGKSIYWADSRAQALGISSLNGIDVCGTDEARDEDVMNSRRAALRMLDKTATLSDAQTLQSAAEKGGFAMGKSAMTRAAYDVSEAEGGGEQDVEEDENDDEDDAEQDDVGDEDEMDADLEDRPVVKRRPGRPFSNPQRHAESLPYLDSLMDDSDDAIAVEDFQTAQRPRPMSGVIVNIPKMPRRDHDVIIVDSDSDSDST